MKNMIDQNGGLWCFNRSRHFISTWSGRGFFLNRRIKALGVAVVFLAVAVPGCEPLRVNVDDGTPAKRLSGITTKSSFTVLHNEVVKITSLNHLTIDTNSVFNAMLIAPGEYSVGVISKTYLVMLPQAECTAKLQITARPGHEYQVRTPNKVNQDFVISIEDVRSGRVIASAKCDRKVWPDFYDG